MRATLSALIVLWNLRVSKNWKLTHQERIGSISLHVNVETPFQPKPQRKSTTKVIRGLFLFSLFPFFQDIDNIFYMLFLFIRLFIFVYGIRRWINMRSLQHNVWIFWTFAHPYLQRTQEIRVLLPVPKCISYKSSDGPAFQWVALSVNSFFFFFFSFLSFFFKSLTRQKTYIFILSFWFIGSYSTLKWRRRRTKEDLLRQL